MSKKISLRYALTAFLAASQSVLASPACVYPVADGADVDPSPESMSGVIVKATKDRVSVRQYSSKQIIVVSVNAATQLFTVYGGGIGVEDLKPGQHAIIWLIGCAAPARLGVLAAVIEVCSLDSTPCQK